MTENGDYRALPVVGYQGGKRRLLPRLRPHFPISDMERYVEPFVGMGALYLDLRARGFRGPAILADAHPQVSQFWRYLHRDPESLIAAADALGRDEATVDRYYAILSEKVDDDVQVVARFLWLTNYAYANAPNIYWNGWSHTTGTKLTSAAKWGKTFPWQDCVARLRIAAEVVHGTPTTVLDEASIAFQLACDKDHIYADPPYHGQRAYTGGRGDFVGLIASAPGRVVLSEGPGVADRLPGWTADHGSVIQRASGGQGARGRRAEVIYVKPVDEEAVA